MQSKDNARKLHLDPVVARRGWASVHHPKCTVDETVLPITVGLLIACAFRSLDELRAAR